MTKPTAVKLTRTNAKTGKCRIVFEIKFPTKECPERERAFDLIGRLMREALPTSEEREQFLAAFNAELKTLGA